ncbi:MAG: TonB-dependent receptor [Burkholderiaceae bacterium]|nr:TonB-dependent receptor [Burkholderiaceae bacterium]
MSRHASRRKRAVLQPECRAHAASTTPPCPPLLPLGAIAAGFGLWGGAAMAQGQPAAAEPAAAAASAPAEGTMPPVRVKGRAESDNTSVRATTTTIGKGVQEVRDIPQSLTVVTEKLMEDRRTETLKQALKQTSGITFQAAEGGEEDIRLRGFPLATSGDIYVDGMRDPAFYDRDTFSYDRVELLRGSASMLFGRGSTGGVVNQVHKQAFLDNASEVSFTLGSGDTMRFTGDFNLKTGERSALRINAMTTDADQWGNFIDKQGLALNARLGIGSDDEWMLGGYHLQNHNGVNYGLPWIRRSSSQTSGNPSTIMEFLDPRVYYNAASDYNDSSASYATLTNTRRFSGGSLLKTMLRSGHFTRDLRAGTIRFCTFNATTAPTCPASPPGLDNVSDATVLNRGTNNKVQEMYTTYLQSDYSVSFEKFGFKHEVLAGLDAAHEEFTGYRAVEAVDGSTLNKNLQRTTLGTPNDGGGFVDESLRAVRRQSAFDAKSIGVYAQDLIQVAEHWKILAGLRYDKVKGSYQSFQAQSSATVALGTVTADRGRSDGLWSKRFGVLFQPSDRQTYYVSHGTSFNTSGDTYQYDLPGSNTPPEASRNIEIGAKLDLFDGRLSTAVAAFRTTKYNERNRDSPNGTPIDDYLLSGQRHANGLDINLAGRISAQWELYGSYTWIPSATIDAGNPDGTTLTGEQVGQRPSMTPRHSGTIWSTYQVTPRWRFGAGLNARSSATPLRNPAGIVAPKFVTGDLLAEYTPTDQVALKLNVLNLTDKHYADSLYSGHYIQGAPRTVQVTLTTRF